jgi:basic amino acid/polyamine antiporter, APA family
MSEDHLVVPSGAAQPALQRRLGLVALTIYGLGNMLGAGIYETIGSAAREMGSALWLAFVASMVAAGLTGLSYACLGSRYPRAAGAAFITQRAYGLPLLTYLIGLSVMASGLTSMATASHVFARYLLGLFELHFSPAVMSWAVLGVVVPFLLMIAFVNFWGIRECAWLNAVCTVIETGGLVLVIVVGVRFIGGVDYLDAHAPMNPDGDLSIGLILGGAVLTFFSFIGFEDLLNVSEEVKDPRRTLPLALVGALAIATLIYVTVSVVAVSVVPATQLAASEKPALYLVIDTAAPWIPAQLFGLVAMFAVVNTALLNYIMGSRLAYGMARQGLLPGVLGRVHPKRHTPHMAIVALLVIVLVLVTLGDIGSLARATALLLLMSFTVVNVALVVLKRRAGEPAGGFEVPIIVPAVGAMVCVVMIGNGVWKMGHSAADLWKTDAAAAVMQMLPLMIALGIVLLIGAMYAILRPRATMGESPPPD